MEEEEERMKYEVVHSAVISNAALCIFLPASQNSAVWIIRWGKLSTVMDSSAAYGAFWGI